MTRQQRIDGLNALFDALPGKNIERIRAICAVLHCTENTVRIWRMKTPSRVIPAAKLRILRDHFSGVSAGA